MAHKTPRCKNCNAPVSGARVVIAGWWWCPSCALLHEKPDATLVPTPPEPLPLQDETLFPLASIPTRTDR